MRSTLSEEALWAPNNEHAADIGCGATPGGRPPFTSARSRPPPLVAIASIVPKAVDSRLGALPGPPNDFGWRSGTKPV